MSSKHAAWRGNKALALQIITFLSQHPLADKESISSLNSNTRNRALYQRLRYLERKGYIQKFGVGYHITPKANTLLHESNIWCATIPTPRKWGKKWYLVVFDIPKDKRKRRDAFRLRLKELGLVLYQNSVWIYPYPLEETVRDIATFYMLSGCVSFITAEKLTGEEQLKKHFKLVW